jgi:P-type conjugative transfer protein TrbJ
MRINLILFFLLWTPKVFSFVVFDPSNFVQNSLTASQTAHQIIQSISQYETQLLQFQTQLKQLSTLDPEKISTLLNVNSVDLMNLNKLKISLTDLYGSLNDVTQNFNNRLQSAQYLGLSWDQYAKFEQDRIQRHQSTAITRANNEISSMERATRDYQFALDAQSLIPSTNGIHESLQLLNSQVNRMLTQNADLIRLMSQSSKTNSTSLEDVDNNSKMISILNIQKRNFYLNNLRYQGELNLRDQLGTGFMKN